MKEIKMYQGPSPADRSMLDVAVGPHCRMGSGLAEIYQRWVIALVPAMAASIYFFGPAALRIFGLSVLFSVAIDLVAEKLAPSRDLTSNWSSVSLGLLLACMMPLNAPWWLILVGCIFMIVVGKKFFGGVGAYPVQPAVFAFAVLQLSWPERMDYTNAMKNMDWTTSMVEPLRLVKSIGAMAADQYHWLDMLLGHQVAGTASGMVLSIFVGGLFLLLTREIQWRAPVGFLAGLLVSGLAIQLSGPADFVSPVFHLLSGGTLFMGLFLITDHTNSPVNKWPLFLYGLLAGVLLILIRSYSKHVDGIAYAVLLVNLCAPLIDMIKPKIKGGEMSEITRLVVVLSLIAGVCSAALTSANILLGPRMDRQTDYYVRGPALERLLEKPADEVLGNKIVFPTEEGGVPVFFLRDGQRVTTLAVEAIGRGGFGGDLKIMVGIDLVNGRQTGMEVVSHSETPGLGARIEEPGFRRQWQGLPIDQPIAITADGGSIDAISGASTTSRAAVRGTNDVLTFVSKNKEQILKMIDEL